MKQKSVVFLFGMLLCVTAYSQSFIGYGYDNYSGVNGMILNPGSLADGKYKVNINLFAVSAFGGNNAYEINRDKLFALHLGGLKEGNGYDKVPNTDFKYVYFNFFWSFLFPPPKKKLPSSFSSSSSNPRFSNIFVYFLVVTK